MRLSVQSTFHNTGVRYSDITPDYQSHDDIRRMTSCLTEHDSGTSVDKALLCLSRITGHSGKIKCDMLYIYDYFKHKCSLFYCQLKSPSFI